MKLSRPLAALALLAAAALGAGGAVHLQGAAAAPAGASPLASPAAAARNADSVRQARRAPGDFRRYAIQSRLQMTVGGAVPVESAPPTLRLEGAWLETVARVEGGRATLVVAFTPSEAAPPTLSRADLSRPFSVELGEDGRVSSVTFARGISGDARQALRAVVAGLQWSRPAPAGARTWWAEEDDTTGRYRASYRADSATAIERHKDGYALVLSDRGLLPPASGERYDVQSDTRYQLDGAGGLVHVGLRESLHVVTGKSTPTIDALQILDVSLTESGHGAVPGSVDGVPEQLASLTAQPGSDRSHDLQMARGADFAAMRTRLAEIERMEPKALRAAATHAIAQTRAVLRLDPMAAFDAARAVADHATPPTTAGVLASALASAGTAEARAALVDLARSEDAATRLTGVRAMTLLQNPDDDSVDTLKSLLDDGDKSVARAASLALGAGVRQGGGASASDANAAAVAALIARYNAATDDATRATVVYALGNAGGREVLPTLQDALSRSAPVAQAAAFALRFVPGDDVDQILAGLLSRGATETRISAAQAVLERDRAAWAPRLTAMLQGQLPDDLRKAIVSALGAGSAE